MLGLLYTMKSVTILTKMLTRCTSSILPTSHNIKYEETYLTITGQSSRFIMISVNC
jgi:hypothetical protein